MRAAFAVLIGAIAIGSFAADLWFLDYFGPFIVTVIPLLSFAMVGSFLLVRRAGDPLGWLLGAAGALLLLTLLANAYGSTAYANLGTGGALPGGELAVWFGHFAYITAFGLLVSAMVRFPDGRPPGRAVAVVLWVFVVFVLISAVGLALADQPIIVPRPPAQTGLVARPIPNPFALHGPLGDVLPLAASTLNVTLALALIAPAALAVRFRRSRGVEREQLKWLTYTAAIVFGLLFPIGLLTQGAIAELAQTASLVGIGLLPVAVGIAVTRYRLYDIDVLIRRTLIYSTVAAVLAVAYLGAVVLFQFVLSPITAGSPIAVAVSTLLVVALFQPLRRRIGSAVDRRFYRSRYHAVRTLDAFAARLRDEVDLEAVSADLLDAVRETVQPATASVWLRSVRD